MIGTHFPRRCGIATFSTYLCDALQATQPTLDVLMVAVSDRVGAYNYPQRVRLELDEQDRSSYVRVANELNAQHCDVVCLQHEFGIYGGPNGIYILEFLNALQSPLITVLHTILSEPQPQQRQIIQAIAERSDSVITVSRIGAELLHEVYGVPVTRIRVIPHGAPDITTTIDKRDRNPVMGEHFTLLSYGLLSVNKGFEDVIRALPAIAHEIPNVRYLILGSTHPNIVRAEGEAYRSHLRALAKRLRVSQRVRFIDQFVPQEDLLTYIQSADICVTPYRFAEQVSSGALSYYVALGKPVVSTPYWYAREMLAGDRGILVPFGSPDAIALEICKLATDRPRSLHMGRRAHLYGRSMRWPAISQTYLDIMANSRPTSAAQSLKSNGPAMSPPPMSAVYTRIERMSDTTGMLQHAKYSIPNYLEGYSTDDNARALIASVLVTHVHAVGSRASEELTTRYLAFLNYALNRDVMRFHNILAYDRRWTDDIGSEECHGRALWALGTTLRYSTDRNCLALARELFHLAVPATGQFTSLRACAFAIFGFYEGALSQPVNAEFLGWTRSLARILLASYTMNRTDEWKWFEPSLTYFNAKLCLALLKSGSLLADAEMSAAGIESLEWLMRIQQPDGAHFVPIGCNGFYERGGHRARFDQQPIDTYATVAACLFAYRITGEEKWRDHAWMAFSWFMGVNDLRTPMYDPTTGGCFDGLQEDRVNLNQGAESTLALMLSIIELELLGLTGDSQSG